MHFLLQYSQTVRHHPDHSIRFHFSIIYGERLKCAARPRPERQYEAKTTTKPLWRAHILKLPRAGRVGTIFLLGHKPDITPPHSSPFTATSCTRKGHICQDFQERFMRVTATSVHTFRAFSARCFTRTSPRPRSLQAPADAYEHSMAR
jgi:hypothetical protein